MRALILTGIAMLAFAGNSVICRLALIDRSIDPASFTDIRIASGAITLLIILGLRQGKTKVLQHGSWRSAALLFAYAICFSYAYVDLNTASGALILFGLVQATMIAMALRSGERPRPTEWIGWTLAGAGFVWLLLPGASAPSMQGALLMALAGVSWGVYSVRGKGESDPLASTAANFTRALIPAVIVSVVALLNTGSIHVSSHGVALAILSGSLTSGVGYVIWYAAIRHLTSMQAALVQLSVPAIAAFGGVLLVAEPLTTRLLVSGLLVIGGISIALAVKFRPRINASGGTSQR
jgi:drug/metabolite transporter (DMT)-like permease